MRAVGEGANDTSPRDRNERDPDAQVEILILTMTLDACKKNKKIVCLVNVHYVKIKPLTRSPEKGVGGGQSV